MNPAADRERRGALAKIHVAKKQMALDEVTYRALLKRTTGKDSAGKCDQRELGLVLDECKRLGWSDVPKPRQRAGARPMAKTPIATKIRALWMSLYHLGEIENPSEEALAAFVERCTDVQALQWLDGEQADQVIRALRGWLRRIAKRLELIRTQALPDHCMNERIRELRQDGAGGVAKAALIETQLALLEELRVEVELGYWWFVGLLRDGAADQLIEKLGALIRAAKKAKHDGGR